MSNEYLAIASLLVGALLGLASSILLSALRQRQEIVLRLLDQYLEIRKEIVEAVSDLTHFDSRSRLDEEVRVRYRDSVAKLYYQHYDFLPVPVLDALLVLHVALSQADGRLFCVTKETIVPLSDDEIPAFIGRCSMYRNAVLIGTLALKSSDPAVRANQAIKLHARNVLFTLNKYATLNELSALIRRFRKVALAEGRITRSLKGKPDGIAVMRQID